MIFTVTTIRRSGNDNTGTVYETVAGKFNLQVGTMAKALEWIKRNLSEYGDGAVNLATREVYEIESWSGPHWTDRVWRVSY